MDFSNKLLDGRSVADSLLDEIKISIDKESFSPRLDVILVGDDPASLSYIRQKTKSASRVGIETEVHRFDKSKPEEAVIAKIEELNKLSEVDGIIVQLPLPEHYDEQKLLGVVEPCYDVDGLNPRNFGYLLAGCSPCFYPPTPSGIVRLLDEYEINMEGQTFALVGMGRLVGRPLAQMLLNRDATVLCLNEYTCDLPSFTRQADVVVAATGVPQLLNEKHFQEDSVVIDAGIHKKEGILVGDVDFSAVAPKVRLITPVPGGVGPLTVAELLHNTLLSHVEVPDEPF